jgi:hypothetical protein
MRTASCLWALVSCVLADVSVQAAEPVADLSVAAVVTPPGLSRPEQKAVAMLVEEVEKRTQLHWRPSDTWPTERGAVIVVGQAAALQKLSRSVGPGFDLPTTKLQPEGFQIRIEEHRGSPVVWVAGNDPRGVLFGVGRLLRALDMDKRKVTLQADFKAASAPQTKLRGHQLGYRPKTNSYDGWDLAQWEQYIRDLVVFGINAVELIPPRSDDLADSPHFPLPPMEMMIGMSRLCADYGLDVWVWYPALDKDYSDPKTVEFALKEWGEVFRKLPRLDAVFVPGGDPGDTPPRPLMALLEKQVEVLHRHHPKATLWVSAQGFNRADMDEFLGILRTEPEWLTGVVHGPQTRMSLADFRTAVPKRYPVRGYPDITHSRTCQYPVPDWDAAFALTEAREVINPRPLGEAAIFRYQRPDTIGFITYSEGCNDDVNKTVWSALGWDSEADILEVLRDYSRYFLGPKYTDTFAHGLLALEKNWEGPALTNSHIQTTLQQFQALERAASPRDRLGWRFQQALYRAYYDAFIRSRLFHEMQLEEQALGKLRQAHRFGALRALADAEGVLARAMTEPPAEDLRARVFALGEALFQSIHMQLSVERYQGMAGRGTNLDTIDRPLNNRAWLLSRFGEIRRATSETERLRQIQEIVEWTNPGPGGFYDDLGNPTCQPHLVCGPGFPADPAFLVSAVMHIEDRPELRKSWCDQAMALHDTPLTLRYTGLDRGGRYRARVVYGSGPVRLVASEKWQVHPLLNKPYERLEFDIPPEATASSVLTLRWNGQPGRGGAGRGCQVAEVWLMKK